MKRAVPGADQAPEQEYVITTAPEAHAVDIARRRRNYLVSMSIRVLCVALLFVVPSGWPQLVVAVGAVFIPYFAVVAANAGGEMFSSTPMASYEAQALSAPSDEADADAGEHGAPPSSSEDGVIVLEPERDPS